MAQAGSTHGRIAIKLAWSLADHVKSQDLGAVFAAETGFKIPEEETIEGGDVVPGWILPVANVFG